VGVCEGLLPLLSVAVGEAVAALLGDLVGELDGAEKAIKALYPSPVML
jgi:hypothetical protein